MIRGRGRRLCGGRTSAALLALMAGATALWGCGGGSHKGASTGTSSPPPVATKAGYIAQANAQCAALAQAIAAVSGNAQPLEVKIEEIVPIAERANARFRAIPVPAGERVPAEWLHERELQVAASKRLVAVSPSSPVRSRAGSEEAEAKTRAQALARKYGLTACTNV